MLECIARASPRSFTEPNIRSAWKKTGILPRSLETVITKLSEAQPSTPTPDPEVSAAEVLRTPSCARDVDSYLNGLLGWFDFTPRSAAQLAKLAKATKQGTADLTLANREIEDLRKAADRQERRKERLPGPTGLLLDKDCALAAELRSKREGKDQAKRLTEECKKLLAELKVRGIVEDKAKRLPKRFESEVQERMAQQNSNVDIAGFTSMQEYTTIASNQ